MYELETDREVLTALTKKVHCKLTLSRLISLFVRIARKEENHDNSFAIYVPNNLVPVIFHAIERNFIDELDYIDFKYDPDYDKEIGIKMMFGFWFEHMDENQSTHKYNLALYNELVFNNNNYVEDFQNEIILAHSDVSEKLIDNIHSFNSGASKVVIFDLLGVE